jgi:four helix bundle protein
MKCENLDVWKKAAALSANIYLHLRDLKDYGFKDQLTRSGLSVPSNIAEGMERASEQEKLRFLDIARASLAEARTQIYIGMKIGYIEKSMGKQWIDEAESIAKMITSLISTIKNTAGRQLPAADNC